MSEVISSLSDLPKRTEDYEEGGDAWVYCKQHLGAHLTGWCTVGVNDKILLDATGHVQAIQECRDKGFKLFQDHI